MEKEFLIGTEKTNAPKFINEGEKTPRYSMGKLPKVEQTMAPKIINEVQYARDLYKTDDTLKPRIESRRTCAPKLEMQSSNDLIKYELPLTYPPKFPDIDLTNIIKRI